MGEFVGEEYFVEEILFFGGDWFDGVFDVVFLVVGVEEIGEVVVFVYLFVDVGGDFFFFVLFGDVGFDFGFYLFVDFGVEGGVGFVEVGGVVLGYFVSCCYRELWYE